MKTPLPATIIIPGAAGGQSGVYNRSSAGLFFYCETASSNFLVQFDAGALTNINPGMQIPVEFKRLTFFNPSAVPVTVTFYVSDLPISSISVTTAQLQNSLASCLLETEIALQASAGAGGAQAALAPAGTYFRRVTLIAQKDQNATPNAGKVYLSNKTGTKTIILNPGLAGANGDVWELQADTGGKRDLGSWFVSADNAGDGVSILGV